MASSKPSKTRRVLTGAALVAALATAGALGGAKMELYSRTHPWFGRVDAAVASKPNTDALKAHLTRFVAHWNGNRDTMRGVTEEIDPTGPTRAARWPSIDEWDRALAGMDRTIEKTPAAARVKKAQAEAEKSAERLVQIHLGKHPDTGKPLGDSRFAVTQDEFRRMREYPGPTVVRQIEESERGAHGALSIMGSHWRDVRDRTPEKTPGRNAAEGGAIGLGLGLAGLGAAALARRRRERNARQAPRGRRE